MGVAAVKDRTRENRQDNQYPKIEIRGNASGDVGIVKVPQTNRLGMGNINVFYDKLTATSVSVDVSSDDPEIILADNSNAASILWVNVVNAATTPGLWQGNLPISAVRITFNSGDGKGRATIMIG